MSVSRADLDWWWKLAREVEWTWAKTFANSPSQHWYIRLATSRLMDREDFVKVGHLIRTYGTPALYFGRPNLYLVNPEGTHRCWRMWEDEPKIDAADLINLAKVGPVFGPQRFTPAHLARVNQLRLPAQD